MAIRPQQTGRSREADQASVGDRARDGGGDGDEQQAVEKRRRRSSDAPRVCEEPRGRSADELRRGRMVPAPDMTDPTASPPQTEPVEPRVDRLRRHARRTRLYVLAFSLVALLIVLIALVVANTR